MSGPSLALLSLLALGAPVQPAPSVVARPVPTRPAAQRLWRVEELRYGALPDGPPTLAELAEHRVRQAPAADVLPLFRWLLARLSGS